MSNIIIQPINSFGETIDFRRLRCFLVLADELHFGRAAARLHMTQPPLSVAMRSLEDELGVVLLKRTTRSVRLTPAGELLRERGQAVLQDLERTSHLLKQLGAGMTGSLAIGFIGIATLLGVPELVRRYRQDTPEVAIELDELPGAALLDRLRERRLDVAFVRVLGSLPSPLAHRPFASSTYQLALPETHPLAKRKRIKLRDLHNAPLLFFPRSVHPQIHDQWMATFRAAEVRPKIVQEARSLQTELALVAAGIGMALMAQCVSQQSPSGVVFRPLSGGIPTVDVHLAWHEEAGSPALERFMALIP